MKEQEIRSHTAHNRYLELVQEDIARYFFDPGQFHFVDCPACNGKKHTLEFKKVGFPYVSCEACGTLFANPRPTSAMLRDFYLNASSSRYWIEEFFLPVAEARREKIFWPRAQHVAERLSASSIGTVGDIGAGFGLFLEELSKLWPDTHMVAIEPSSKMAAICRSKGLDVAQATIEELEGYEGRFDVVTAFELLEHLYEPQVLLEQAFQLLRSGGYFLATTLNGKGYDVQVLWEHSKSVFPPHHLNFLNPHSLVDLCESVGFHVEEISTLGQLDWDIVEGAIMNDGVDVGRFWSLLARTGTENCKREFQLWLSKHGLSSHMRIWARRP
ncbi:class I SAM-dependent methyltransferase [Nitrospiraceae bacterium AH_259_D15_M11_P09]|nr:class I SAM-dependent methyltransferase [Nitrospiraceae bacterium AH_259_D15_M11_P09]